MFRKINVSNTGMLIIPIEVSLAKAFKGDVYISIAHTDVFHELAERRVCAKDFRVSGKE